MAWNNEFVLSKQLDVYSMIYFAYIYIYIYNIYIMFGATFVIVLYLKYITIQNFGVGKIFERCIYLIKNTVN